MKKNVAIVLVFTLSTAVLQAQWKVAQSFGSPAVHNVSVALEGGLGGLLIDKSISSPTKLGFNAGGGVGYTFYFDENWGIHSGASFSYISSGYKADGVNSSYSIDNIETWYNGGNETGLADVTSRTADVVENYKTMMVELPIQVAYTHEWLWINAGVRLSLPLSINADYTYGPTKSGITHFYSTDVYVEGDPIPLEGALSLDAENGSYSAHKVADKFRIFATLSVEGGYRIPMENNSAIYIGLFVDYGLNSFNTEENEQFISSILNNVPSGSGGTTTTTTTEFNGALKSNATDSYKNLTTGIRAYYSFGLGKTVGK